MELKLIETGNSYIPAIFGISAERTNLLLEKLSEIFQEECNIEVLPISKSYQKIAQLADTIEEFAFMLHVYIFHKARNGHLKNELI